MNAKKTLSIRCILVGAAALLLAPLPLMATGGEAEAYSPPAEREHAAPPAERDHAPPAERDHAPPAERDHAPPAPQAQPEAPEVSDSELSSFVDCYVEVQKIRERFDGPISEADNPAEAEAIQQEAVSKMTEAIEDSGLDVDTYNNIAAAIAQDPEVNVRFNRMLQEQQED